MQRRAPHRSILIPLSVVAALLVGAAGTAQADDPGSPGVTVTPSAHLAGGDAVTVVGWGLPASTPVRVVQCDAFDNPDGVCADSALVTTASDGTLSTTVVLRDPIIVSDPGSGHSLYCRADTCRIGLLTEPTEDQQEQVLAVSDTLEFSGSPATVAVRPNENLRRRQWVRVTGTAYGAEGQRVRLVEQGCYHLIQENGCYAAAGVTWTRVGSDGTFAARYHVRRFLSHDGNPVDCADLANILGNCVISATVYRPDGTPDDSFGIEAFGEPMAFLWFRPPRS